MDDRELVAREIVEGLFKDIRDRRTLKWFFNEHGEGNVCSHFEAISLDVQGEISAAWRQIVLAALAKAGRLVPEVEGDVVEAAARELVPFSYGAFELQRDENGERVQPPGQPNALAILAVVAVSKILAADAERRVRAEIENIVSDAILQSQALGRSELELRLDAITAIRNGVPHA